MIVPEPLKYNLSKGISPVMMSQMANKSIPTLRVILILAIIFLL